MSACSSCSNQDYRCESLDAMAEQSPTKRARVEIEVPSFTDVDLETFTMKDNGKGTNGHRAFPLVDDEPIRFNLTPDGWLKTVFGFDITTKFEKPSFLGGKEPENGASEGLALRVNLQQPHSDFLAVLDGKCNVAFTDITKNIWNDLVTEDNLFGNTSTKVTVVLKGAGLTKIAVVADGKIARGEGWDFLKTYIDAGNTFRHAEVKVVARVKKLWHVSGKAGIKLEATQIVLRTTDKPQEADAFADDSELLA